MIEQLYSIVITTALVIHVLNFGTLVRSFSLYVRVQLQNRSLLPCVETDVYSGQINFMFLPLFPYVNTIQENVSDILD